MKTLKEELNIECAVMDRDRHAWELDRYRAVETVREKWVACEQRVIDELDKVREEIQRCKSESSGADLSELAIQLSNTHQRLIEANEQTEMLKRENEVESDLLYKNKCIDLTRAGVPTAIPATPLDVFSAFFYQDYHSLPGLQHRFPSSNRME